MVSRSSRSSRVRLSHEVHASSFAAGLKKLSEKHAAVLLTLTAADASSRAAEVLLADLKTAVNGFTVGHARKPLPALSLQLTLPRTVSRSGLLARRPMFSSDLIELFPVKDSC